MVPQTIQRIAQLNDAFRKGDPSVPGMRFFTAGIIELLKMRKVDGDEIVQIVSEFNVFTEENDPHGEHGFGAFELHGHQLFWKLDCYDPNYALGSDDPTDLNKTRRVLTIMLAHEW